MQPTKPLRRWMGLALGLCLLTLQMSCLERELRPLIPCVRQGVILSIQQNAIEKVDLLFVIDNSNSMSEEQAALRQQIPRLVTALVEGDRNGDHVPDFTPVSDLHIGVVSTDLGSAGVDAPGCFGRSKTCTRSDQCPSGVCLSTRRQCACRPVTVDHPEYATDCDPGLVCELNPRSGNNECVTRVGDDGLLSMPVATGRRPASGTPGYLAGCGPTYPQFLSFRTSDDPAADAAQAARTSSEFACLANLGTGGCGLEQQLEAPLKALWPGPGITGDPPRGAFVGFETGGVTSGTTGHGQAENAGFLRPDSVLAIVVVTDEEDCSVQDRRFFDSTEGRWETRPGGPLNTRCAAAPIGFRDEVAFPVARYVEGFRRLRAQNPELLVFAAITGVPPQLVDRSANPDAGAGAQLDAVLADPSLQERLADDPLTACMSAADCQPMYQSDLRCCAGPRAVDPTCTEPRSGTSGVCRWARPTLIPSCDDTQAAAREGRPTRGIALPPRRIIEVAKGLGGIVQSICQENFLPAVSAIIDRIADALGNVCLPRALNPSASGVVPCDVLEVLPATGDITRCAELADRGRTLARTTTINGELREVCRIAQLPRPGVIPPSGAGWYYDDFSMETANRCPASNRQRIAFTRGGTPAPSSIVNLECLQPVQQNPGVTSGVGIGTPCDPSADVCTGARRPGTALERLTCEPTTRSCQVPCAVDADCTTGFSCARTLGDVNLSPPAQLLTLPYCVNPTC